MKTRAITASLILCLVLSGAAVAQDAKPADPAALAAARDAVSKMQGDRAAVLQSMSAPMTGLIAQMGVRDPERAQVLVREVVIPTMSAHYDEFLDVQAQAYASSLSASDLQALAAFYGSPAGRNFAAAQPKLAQAQVTGMSQWLSKLAPELQAKLMQTVKSHGWDAAPK